MEYDLTQGLRDLSRTPPVTPLPTEPVVSRVRRGRTIRATVVGLASAAVVFGAAAVVYAAPWDPAPAPPATLSPTQEPTPTPTPTSTTEPSPEPTDEPTPEDPPIVALTTTGDLVLLDPETGETLEVIASDDALRGPISLTPDRSAAYMTREEGWPRQVVRVSLEDGAITEITDGYSPSLSPNGRTLAYVAPYNINHPEDPEWRSLALLDLTTGDVEYMPDNSCGGCARRIDQPAWSPDGTRLYIAAGFFDGPAPNMGLIVIDPSAPPVDLQAAAPFAFADANPRNPVFPTFLPNGHLAMAGVADFGTGDSADGASSFYGYVEVVDVSTGVTLQFEQHSALHLADWSGDLINWTLDTASPPAGRGLAIVAAELTSPGVEPRYWLFLQSGSGLQPLTQGIIAVAW